MSHCANSVGRLRTDIPPTHIGVRRSYRIHYPGTGLPGPATESDLRADLASGLPIADVRFGLSPLGREALLRLHDDLG